MRELATSRLRLEPLSRPAFNAFVEKILTDPKVVEFYPAYQQMRDMDTLHADAERDFWDHFEESRANTDLEIWGLFERDESKLPNQQFCGWVGILETELTSHYGCPELQYMLSSKVHGLGYATEAAAEVLRDARQKKLTPEVIAVVDIPNIGSIRVLEKLEFRRVGQVNAYGSPDMYLYTKSLN
jgi:RimJ/RimL family protein N-acetyltransferase